MIERTNPNGSVQAVFPVYDAHGNNVATLSRNGSGGFSLGDWRTYDAWGVVRSQQSGGDPKLRYCASLGHKADDESGLVYMRARYYEPGSGRFVSEDPAHDGWNLFSYCAGDPVNAADPNGCWKWKQDESGGYGQFCFGAATFFTLAAAGAATAAGQFMVGPQAAAMMGKAVILIATAATFAAGALSGVDDFNAGSKLALQEFRIITSSTVLMGICTVLGVSLSQSAKSNIAWGATASAACYSVMVLGALVGTYED